MLALSRKMLKRPFLSRMITMLEPMPPYKKIWMEICTDNEEDWKAWQTLCCQGFEDSSWAKLHFPDLEKRKKYLPLFLNYQYENLYNKGRAGLVCVKGIKNERADCKPEVIMGGGLKYDMNDFTEGDKSELEEIDKLATEQLFGREKWNEEHIHTPLRQSAASLGIESWFLIRLVVDSRFRYRGIGNNYSKMMSNMLNQDGIDRRWKDRKNDRIVPFNYLHVTDVGKGVREFHKRNGGVELAHLHYNYKPGMKCVEDPSANKGDQFSCVFVFSSKKIPMMDVHKSYLK